MAERTGRADRGRAPRAERTGRAERDRPAYRGRRARRGREGGAARRDPAAGPRGPGRADRLRARARYWFDNVIARGTPVLVGWLSLACVVIVVPASVASVWTEHDPPGTLAGRVAAVWQSVGSTLRLGGALGTPLYILLSVVLALVTLLFVSTLVSLITSGINTKIMALRTGRSEVLEEHHTVLLGWSDQVFPIVAELVEAHAHRRRSVVAVLAPRHKVEMEDEIATQVGRTGRTRVVCRSGEVTDPAVLARVGPAAARAVLVLPPRARDGDGHVVKTLLALDAALPDGDRPVVVAAVRDSRHLAAAVLAAGARGRVVDIDDVTARLVVQTSREPGLAAVHQELLDFAGEELYTVREPALTGRTFGDALLAFATACPAGIVGPDGRTVLCPPPGTVIGDGDRLVVVARDDASAVLTAERFPVDTAAFGGAAPARVRPEHLLVLGWNRRAPRVLRQLADRVPPGTRLDVVAPARAVREEDAAARTGAAWGPPVRLGAEAAGPDGAGAVPVPEAVPVPGARAAVEAEAVIEAEAVLATEAGGGREAMAVRFADGDPADPVVLAGLGVCGYDGVIVLGDPGGDDGDPAPDDRTLVTLLHLRGLLAGRERRPSVVAELADDRNHALAPASPGQDIVVSGRLISLLMTQISQNRHLAAVFDDLLSSRGPNLHLRPVGDYVRAGGEVTFATVVAAARHQGHCAIGLVRDGGEPRLNPPKTTAFRPGPADRVVVLCPEQG